MTATVWILGDQLVQNHPALVEAVRTQNRRAFRVLFIESEALKVRLPYHKKKLVLLLSAMRHYAEDLKAQGYKVDYVKAKSFSEAISKHIQSHATDIWIMMAASSYRGQLFQKGLQGKFGVSTRILPNMQFLSNQFDPFPEVNQGETIRQESFYREMRKHFSLLMDDSNQPEGGLWNFDKRNRQRLPGAISIPDIIPFSPDAITQEILKEVDEQDLGMGDLDSFDLAVTATEAQQAAEDFFANRLLQFGTYEDAMRTKGNVLFHSKLSPYLNLGLLDPLALVQEAERSYREGKAEINNVEGFIRQVIGWREYMYWQYQQLMPRLAEGNYWGAHRDLPAFFWNGETEMNCLGCVLARVQQDGYAHHIERLMILSNFCLLAGIEPIQVLDWFQAAFIDAYDWVMVPNVLGMGLYADGGGIATKPYIASANYIHKMSDFCTSCRYDRKKRVGDDACPYNFLYWHFMIKNEKKLRENYRMTRTLYHLKNFDEEERNTINKQSEKFLNG